MEKRFINNFIKWYERDKYFYEEIWKNAKQILEEGLRNKWIKGIVSYRIKDSESLRKKIIKKGFKNKREIVNGIYDFCWLRIALYFPSQKEIVYNIIKERFHIRKVKSFPLVWEYWYKAKHFRVQHTKQKYHNLCDTIFEIQVASVLMHWWSEVEHDILYKNPNWWDKNLKEETEILLKINRHTQESEKLLDKLSEVIAKKSYQQKEINDSFNLTNLVFNNYKAIWLNNLNLWNIEYLTKYLRNISASIDISAIKVSSDRLRKISEDIVKNLQLNYSDELLSDIITKNEKNIENFIHKSNFKTSHQSVIRKFLLLYSLISKIQSEIYSQFPNWSHNKAYSITRNEHTKINQFKNIRNQIAHNDTEEIIIERTTLAEIDKFIGILILKIKDKKKKDIFSAELEKIMNS